MDFRYRVVWIEMDVCWNVQRYETVLYNSSSLLSKEPDRATIFIA